ncbi:MAG TPA: hypothetical protein VN841_03800 [Bryobacteraceae bacterium]|nr:hypothetical protein [Bryobacteraceae bacterium]
MASNTAVYGLCRDRRGIEEVMGALKQGGFRNTDIAVLFPENHGSKDFAHKKSTKAPEGAVIGAGSAAVVAGTLGWLAGAGLLAIPGAGPLLAAGPVMALLAGVGLGGTVGAVVGALIGVGFPEYEAKRFDGRIKGAGILFSVHCDSFEWMTRAKDLLKKTCAGGIASAPETRADFLVTDKPLPASTEQSTPTNLDWTLTCLLTVDAPGTAAVERRRRLA